MPPEFASNLPFIATIVIGLAVPFYIGYAFHPAQWRLLIPAWFLTALPVITPLSDLLNPDLLALLISYALALPFLVCYLANRKLKWSLVIADTLGIVATIPLSGFLPYNQILGSLVIFIISMPFFLVIFMQKRKIWPLITTFIFLNIGLLALADIFFPGLNHFSFLGLRVNNFSGLLPVGIAITGVILRSVYSSHSIDRIRLSISACVLIFLPAKGTR